MNDPTNEPDRRNSDSADKKLSKHGLRTHSKGDLFDRVCLLLTLLAFVFVLFSYRLPEVSEPLDGRESTNRGIVLFEERDATSRGKIKGNNERPTGQTEKTGGNQRGERLFVSEDASTPFLRGVIVTSYNDEIAQTDSTPCIAGGNNIDICAMAREGRRPIAASQDLLVWAGGTPFNVYDKITLKSTDYPDDWRCNGEFEVVDGMNKRYGKRLDIFFLDRKDNISCIVDVYLTSNTTELN